MDPIALDLERAEGMLPMPRWLNTSLFLFFNDTETKLLTSNKCHAKCPFREESHSVLSFSHSCILCLKRKKISFGLSRTMKSEAFK